MKYLILSDLHLGSPLFKYELELIHLLNDNKFDKIIINGDIFDIWELPINKIISKYIILINIINNLAISKSIIIIRGNHDPNITVLSSIFYSCNVVFQYEYNNNIVIHGSEFDDLIMKYSIIAKFLGYINWFFERIHLDLKTFFRELFYSISAKRQKKYYNDLISDIEKSAVDKYKDTYDFIIMGHTHMPKISDTYINCGDMIHNYTYVIDDDNDFKLFNLRSI